MHLFFEKAFEKFVQERFGSPEEIAYHRFPAFLLELMQRYLRVHTEGLEHLPAEGPAILIANHSGYMGFDAMMLAYQVFQKTGRVPKIVAHKLWFLRPEIAVPAEKFGLVPATFRDAEQILEQGDLLLLFPEGEEGNFKPTSERYRLKPFRRGFLRLAYSVGCPVIPASVVGAEETHITLSQLRWAKELFGILVPLPLNIVPLPAKWSIRFYPPFFFPKEQERLGNLDSLTHQAKTFRRWLQHQLHEELKQRKTVFIP